MTDTQHTPGPWRIEDTVYKHSPQIVSEQGSFVADTDRHNARLIAAAPELLDVLMDAESAMFRVRAYGGFATGADRKAMDDAWAAVRAAIAKATGQTA